MTHIYRVTFDVPNTDVKLLNSFHIYFLNNLEWMANQYYHRFFGHLITDISLCKYYNTLGANSTSMIKGDTVVNNHIRFNLTLNIKLQLNR